MIEMDRLLKETQESIVRANANLLDTVIYDLKKERKIFEEKIFLGIISKTKEEIYYPIPGIFLSRNSLVKNKIDNVGFLEKTIAKILDVYFIPEMDNYLLVKKSIEFKPNGIVNIGEGYERRMGLEEEKEKLLRKIDLHTLIELSELYLKQHQEKNEDIKRVPFSQFYLEHVEKELEI